VAERFARVFTEMYAAARAKGEMRGN